jgi:hypothetical protein
VAATLVAPRTLPENSRVPASSDQRQKVARAANKISCLPFAAFPLPESSFLKLFCSAYGEDCTIRDVPTNFQRTNHRTLDHMILECVTIHEVFLFFVLKSSIKV